MRNLGKDTVLRLGCVESVREQHRGQQELMNEGIVGDARTTVIHLEVRSPGEVLNRGGCALTWVLKSITLRSTDIQL